MVLKNDEKLIIYGEGNLTMQLANHNQNIKSGPSIDGFIKPEEPIGWKLWKRKRYIVIVMTSLGFFNAYTLRTNLSVAIVAMTEYHKVEYENGTVSMEQELPWNSKDKGLILSSFYFGYILTNFLGGYLGYRIGGTRVLGFGIGMTALLTLLTPLAVSYGKIVFCVLRAIMGLFEGLSIPSMYDIHKRWTPPNERSVLLSITLAGTHIGTITAMLLSGVIAASLNWQSIFYIFGSAGVIWYLSYLIIVYESPVKDKFISSDERRYIQQSLEIVTEKKNHRVPWKSIFTSTAYYALCIAGISQLWGFYTFLTQMPTFLRQIMHFEVSKSGIMSAAPYIMLVIFLCFSGWLADFILTRQYLQRTQLRRIYTCLSFIAQGSFLILASYLSDPVQCVLAMCFAVGLEGFALNGFLVSLIEIAPHFSSVLAGLTNTTGTISAIIAPILTGFLTQNGTPEEWRTVFFIATGIYAVGAIVFGIWGTSEQQPWAIVSDDDEHKESGDDGAKNEHINESTNENKY